MNMFDKEEALEQLLSDVENLLEDLYQSGFDTVHDSTLEALDSMVRRTAAYGMELLSELLSQLTGGLTMRRHQMEKKEDALVRVYTQLYRYVSACRGKIECDKGVRYYMQ
ncbi:MAG: hypothetical protein K2I96_12575 [Lachnospiraceae bacterium]|nr:hypothetical protein [Lachnospiraceae bacterium]